MDDNEPILVNSLENDYEEESIDEVYIDEEEYNNNLYDKIYDIYTRMNIYIKDFGLNLLHNHSLDNFIKFYLSETGNKFLIGDTHVGALIN
jgi:hypothetical protein